MPYYIENLCHIIKGDVVTMAAYIHHDTGENQNNIIQSVVTTCYEMIIRPIKDYSFPLINLEYLIQKYTHTISSSQRLNAPQETQLEYYTQEDEENNFNAENTRNTSHYYQEGAHEKPYHIVKPKVTHFQPHKRKLSESQGSDAGATPSICIQKIPRCNTYTKLTTDIPVSETQEKERRRCTSIPHSYSEIDEFYMNNASQLLPTIRCQTCHRVLIKDTIYMGADMTYCSVHCRHKSFNSLVKLHRK